MADNTRAPGSYTGTGGRQRCLYISILLGLACVFNIHNFGKYMVDLSVTSRTIDWTMEPRHEPTNLNDDRNNTSKGILRAPDFLAAEQQIDRTARYTVGNDWYNKERFDAQFEEQCLVVDNICLSSGRWWYKPLEEGVDGYQPPFILHARLDGAVGYPEMINVTSIHDLDVAQQTSNAQCAVSPIIDHIIMYSYYNTMLGEFYARILKGLFEISRTADDYMDFLQQTQVYVHMYNKNDKTMLESHHIFTDAFRGHPLLDLKVLLHTAGCRCLQRLFLCGYNIDPPNRKAQKKLSSSNKGISLTPGEGISAKNQEAFAEVRKVLLKRVIDENPFMQADIQAYREKALRSKNIEGNFNDWKVIGLSQRSGRRRWIGLTEIEQKCDLVLRSHKIICVEVNVESAEFHPYNHAVVHGGLDALFGIHGAQITEAMWMKPGSLAVEFLPWVHEDLIMGTWTRSVKEPTPVGVMFIDTDLNYIGFPLTRHSAPYCYGLEKKDEINCWRSNHWDERNFEAPPNSVIDAVTMFFVNTTNNNSCDMYNEWAEDEFVLYNVHCQTENGALAIQHFPWKKRLEDMPKYTNYSNYLLNKTASL